MLTAYATEDAVGLLELSELLYRCSFYQNDRPLYHDPFVRKIGRYAVLGVYAPEYSGALC